MLVRMIDCMKRRINRYANDLLAPQGLTMNQALLLLAILDEEGVSARRLGERTDFDSASLAGLLNRLERLGLIERAADERDRRRIRVRATSDGKRLKPAILTALGDLEERIRRAIPSADREALDRATQAVLSELP